MEAKLFIFATVTISGVFSLCGPRETKFVNFQEKLKRRVPYIILATTKKCPGLDEFYYKWTVTMSPSIAVVDTSDKASIVIDGYKYDSKTCYTNTFSIKLSVSHYPDMSMASTTQGSFIFVPDTMHIEIEGGSEKTHMYGQDLIVDAQKLSRDDSYPLYEDAFAGNNITWKILPEIPGFEAPPSLVLRIPSQLLKKKGVYHFKVTVVRTKIPNYIDTQWGSQYVEVISGQIPQLTMKCVRNCIGSHNLEPTAFFVECKKFCKNLKYIWKLNPKPRGRIDFGTGYNRIIIYENAYKAGEKFTVTLKCNGARFVKTIHFTKGTQKGRCEIQPKSGTSLVTKFKITCLGFTSPFGITAYMVYQYFGNEKVLIDTYTPTETSEVYLSSGRPAKISVRVQDNAYFRQEVFLKLNVREYFSQNSSHFTATIKSLVLAQQINSVQSYSFEGFTDKVIQLVSLLLIAISDFRLDKATTADLHKHMAEAILRSPSYSFPGIIQKLLILTRLIKFKLEEDTTTSTLVAKGMVKNSLRLHRLHVTQSTIIIPQFYVERFCEQNVELFSKLIEKSKEVMIVLNQPHPPHFYESYDEFDSDKIQIRENYKIIINSAIMAFQFNSLTLLIRAIPDQKSGFFDTDNISFVSKRKNIDISPEHIEATKKIAFLRATKSLVHLSNELVFHLNRRTGFADYIFVVFKNNPFWWHVNASTFTTDFILFDLFVEQRKVKTTAYPILIDLKFRSVPIELINGTLIDSEMVTYRIELESNNLLEIELKSLPKFEPFSAAWSDCSCKEEDFTSSRAVQITSHTRFRNYISVRTENEKKVIYLCIKKIAPTLSYLVRFASFSCLRWDEGYKEWTAKNCKAVNTTVFSSTPSILCECFHLSLYTGQVSIPKTTVNLDKNFDLALFRAKNYLMVKVVGVLLSLWLIFLLLAHRRDKAVQKKNVIYKLDDNVPGDSHPYLVVVFTGIFYDAHTTADVAIQIVGKKSKSRVHLLKCHNATFLNRNAQDWFTVFTPFYLGEIKKIRIWHNSKGKYPHWYCERVIVQDLKTSEQYCFNVKKWFSVIWGSGKYYREIIINRHNMRKKLIFMTQLEKQLKDNHLWMSILTRDIQSNFNSKERVSVGFCFLFLSMLANALLYGIPRGGPQDSIDEQSSFYITLANIVIFFMSWIVATPFGLFIIFIFKNSAPL